MEIVNLTPHTVNIYDLAGKQLLATIEPTAPAARCTTTTKVVGEANGLPLVMTDYGEVEGLPRERPHTLYIVSLLVRQALPDRYDLASPGELLRDEKGQPVGCKGLVVSRPPMTIDEQAVAGQLVLRQWEICVGWPRLQ